MSDIAIDNIMYLCYAKLMSDIIKEITMRDFLRSPKSFLPPPSEGIKITRRDGLPFYIYPDVRQTNGMSDKKQVMSDKELYTMSDILTGGVEEKIEESDNTCKHGSLYGLCKFGCQL